MKEKISRNNKGFTLIEMLACVVLVTFVFLMSFSVITMSSETYATEATKTQAEIFLSQNVAKISQLMRYADMDIGIITNREKAKGYISDGVTANVDSTHPLFCTRVGSGSTGCFINSEDNSGETSEGVIAFLNTVTKDQTNIISNSSDYKLRAEIIFFTGNEEDYDDSGIPSGTERGTNSRQFDFEVRVYASDFGSLKEKGEPICSSHQIIVPIEETLK